LGDIVVVGCGRSRWNRRNGWCGGVHEDVLKPDDSFSPLPLEFCTICARYFCHGL
jgi:hypothetical protein